ncbi:MULTISPECIES: hypothetical protein [unclassified Streptomyces]|uniref:hypothetical protein n=1 Tax=unclassified Streptomyces TaxID=2593676 RepID=UPI00131DE2A1|nr:hypothetical protein [Streptomyces sp. NRRL F-5727]
MDAIAESLNSLRADATRRITEVASEGHEGRVFVQLRTRTTAEAIASWLGTRPTR